jgi:DNA-directed RNA polymerase specialized sigma24 family protein
VLIDPEKNENLFTCNDRWLQSLTTAKRHGLEIAEIAQLQEVAERTVFRDWRRARAFLIRELGLVEQADT